MAVIDTRYSWLPLPGPELERVMLCGWTDSAGGYWWYEEGVLDGDGLAIESPRATHWCPIILPLFPGREVIALLTGKPGEVGA